MTPGRKLMLLVERISGIVLPERELQRLTDWAERRAALRGFNDINAYIEALRREPGSEEWRFLLSRVTVKESSLFRAPQQFSCLRDSIIPELVAAGRKNIRVWSAGCARGEEPATLAVVLAECLAGTNVQWSILGTDVDADALESARQARFSRRSVRRVPMESLERHFTPRSDSFELNSNILSHIHFDSLNLIEEPFEVPGQPFDVILLRNVLIYFRKESQARVVEGVQQTLAPDGFLFVGPSESLMHLAPNLKAEKRKGVFVYRMCDESKGLNASELGGGQSSAWKSPFESSKKDQRGPTHRNQIGDSTENPEVFAVEGHRAEVRGDLRAALRCYRACLYLQPELYQIRYRLGLCLEKVGWSGRGLAEFRAVLEILRLDTGKTLEILTKPDFPSRNQIEAECRVIIQKVGPAPP